jgi:hypothetical protein
LKDDYRYKVRSLEKAGDASVSVFPTIKESAHEADDGLQVDWLNWPYILPLGEKPQIVSKIIIFPSLLGSWFLEILRGVEKKCAP